VPALRRIRKLATLLRWRARRSRAALRGAPRLDWAIRISAPDDATGDVWGDVFFAHDLARALERLGQNAHVDRHDSRYRPVARVRDDVVVHLVGLRRPEPVLGAVNILWVISHPEMITEEELDLPFDLRYAASEAWARGRSRTGRPVLPLLQATDPSRFSPGPARADMVSDVLFVGKTRAIYRPIVRDAIAADADLTIYGDGWGEFIDPGYVRSEFLANDLVPDAYRGARVVLNDHWQDMADQGFAANRLFDAVAAGAIVVSDSVDGLPPEFAGMVRAYDSVDRLRQLIEHDEGWPARPERERIAREVAERHSFGRRADSLLQAVLGLRGGSRSPRRARRLP
jgi:hypothetical protein